MRRRRIRPLRAWRAAESARILIGREIGHGGKGIVYSSVRANGVFNKKFAFKVAQYAVPSEQIVARFRQEREILGRLGSSKYHVRFGPRAELSEYPPFSLIRNNHRRANRHPHKGNAR